MNEVVFLSIAFELKHVSFLFEHRTKAGATKYESSIAKRTTSECTKTDSY